MNKRNVFIFTEMSVAARYGIGTYIQQLASCLLSNFHVNIIILFSEINKIEDDIQFGIRYLSIPYKLETCCSQSVDEEELRYFKRVIYLLKREIAEGDIPYFHFNTPSHLLACLLRKEFANLKLFYTIHYMEWKAFFNGNMGRMNRMLENVDKRIEAEIEKDKLFIDNCDVVIALSLDSYNILVESYKVESNKVFYIPNSVDDIFNENFHREKMQIKKKYGFNGNEKIILFVGRLVPNKGIVELVEAFKSLLIEEPNLRLVLVGDGCYDICLKHVAPFFSKICFTGFVDRKMLIEFYHIADIGVLPSYFEECSYVALEMMAAKLPLVATNVSGLSELIAENGMLAVECGDQRKLEMAILKLINVPFYKEDCIKRGRLKYEQLYSLDIFKQKILSIYCNI